jgi:hypothetical protein
MPLQVRILICLCLKTLIVKQKAGCVNIMRKSKKITQNSFTFA